MNDSKTLLELAGASPIQIDWKKAALILIDYQREYTDGQLALGDRAKTCVNNAIKLIKYARDRKAPIFHVVHHGAPGGNLFNPDSATSELIPEIIPLEEEPLVVKRLPNAFINTNLRELIGLTDRSQLVFGGFMSHMCISSSVRASLDLGYTNFVCSDTCFTRDLADARGGTIAAETVHECSMAALRDRFATVLTAESITRQPV